MRTDHVYAGSILRNLELTSISLHSLHSLKNLESSKGSMKRTFSNKRVARKIGQDDDEDEGNAGGEKSQGEYSLNLYLHMKDLC